jgi:hypothetical protein
LVYDLSYDPRDPLYPVPGLDGVRWGIQVFTTKNLYGLDPDRTQVTEFGDKVKLTASGLSWAGQQQRSEGRVEATVIRQGDVTCWHVEAWHAEPIKCIKVQYWGLPEDTLNQGWWQAVDPEGVAAVPTPNEPLRWCYPWPRTAWLTPWACAGEGTGAITLSVRDAQVRPKRLYVYLPLYNNGKPVVEIICDEDATRWDSHFATPEIRLRMCGSRTDVTDDFEAHLGFVERAYGLRPWEQRSDVPGWFQDVRLVVTLHGQHWTGYVFNTFDRMAETLRFMTRHLPGKHILAYLPGWEGRYYFAYPHYQPGEAMGGDAAFGRLMDTARELGVHMMPMFGANGTNVQLYPDWERAVFRNPSNRYVDLINCPDWDTDRAGEGDQVFLNPGEPTYRNHLIEQVSRVVRAYDLEGVFLDTSACWFNDPRYNLYEGYQALLGELRQRHPGVLFAGEGWWDALLALFPVNQSWMGIERRYRFPQLMTRYARALEHLMDGTPVTGSSGVHEYGFNPRPRQIPTFGHIPALGITDDTLAKYGDEVIAVCQAATNGA